MYGKNDKYSGEENDTNFNYHFYGLYIKCNNVKHKITRESFALYKIIFCEVIFLASVGTRKRCDFYVVRLTFFRKKLADRDLAILRHLQ